MGKQWTVCTVSPSVSHEVMGPDAMIFIFWMSSFKPTFSLSSFTLYWISCDKWKRICKNHNGKESVKRMYSYTFLTESLCCIAEIGNNIVNQLYFKIEKHLIKLFRRCTVYGQRKYFCQATCRGVKNFKGCDQVTVCSINSPLSSVAGLN